jgi:sugar lactone lactonase YvrE
LLRYKGQTGELINRDKAGASGYLEDVSFTPDGGLLVINSAETLWRFDAQGKALLNMPAAISQITDKKELNLSGTVDGQGNLYLLGHFNQGVFKFSPQGKYLSRFGSAGSQPGQFQAPERIAVDGLGRVYVTDIKGVQIFDANGRYLGLIKVEGAAFGMAVDDQNNLFVVTNKPKVYKFKVSLLP